jgi:hypothetical protein
MNLSAARHEQELKIVNSSKKSCHGAYILHILLLKAKTAL